jgi:hypothetical protein
MFYDPERNILYDTETGAELPIIEDADYPEEIKQQLQMKKDHDFALSLSSSSNTGRGKQVLSSSRYLIEDDGQQLELASRRHGGYDNLPADGEMKMAQELIDLRMNEAPENPLAAGGGHEGGGWMDDFTLARALQAMEFEIAGETLDRGDFDEKEYSASSCKRQLLTISTLILLTQVLVTVMSPHLTLDRALGGDDPRRRLCPSERESAHRPASYHHGPPAQSTPPTYTSVPQVRYGAKEAALILYRHEWWRLISPIFLHAGVLHILSNGIIQVTLLPHSVLTLSLSRS